MWAESHSRAGPGILAKNPSTGKGDDWLLGRATFAQGRSLATQSSDTLRSRSQVFRKLHQGRGAAVMDIPPLAGRTVAMSLGALPVSYVLNQVSAFSQYVFVHEDHGAGGKMRGSPAP